MAEKKLYFHSPSLGRQSLSQVAQQIASFIKEEPGYYYRLVIGSDSQDYRSVADGYLNLVAAIVIYRQGRGGRYFWHKKRVAHSRSLREKIYKETLLSLAVAKKLLPLLRRRLNGDEYELEIHIDVGDVGPTREMIKEVVAMVNGNGFKAKTKPASYGASSVADRYT